MRELRNIVIRLIAKYSGKTVDETQLLAEFDLHTPEQMEGMVDLNDDNNLALHAKRHLKSHHNIDLDVILKNWERAYLEAALLLTHGNLSQAAKLLGVNRTTLYSRMNTLQEMSIDE